MSVYVQVHSSEDFYRELLDVEPPLRTTKEKIRVFEDNVSRNLEHFRLNGQVIYIDEKSSTIEDARKRYQVRIAPKEGDIVLHGAPNRKENIDTIVETMKQLDANQATVGGIYEDACVLGLVEELLERNKKVYVMEACTDGILRDDGDKMLGLVVFSTNENVTVTPYSKNRLKIVRKGIKLRNDLRNWRNLTKNEREDLFRMTSELTTKTSYVFNPFSSSYSSELSEPIHLGDVKTVLCVAGETGLSVVKARRIMEEEHKTFI